MSEQDMIEIHSKLKDHQFEITTLKNSTGQLVESLNNSTVAMQRLSEKFAVYVEKHDSTQKDIEYLKGSVRTHGEDLASIKPVVEAMRGIVWKIASSVILGMGSISAIVAIISKSG